MIQIIEKGVMFMWVCGEQVSAKFPDKEKCLKDMCKMADCFGSNLFMYKDGNIEMYMIKDSGEWVSREFFKTKT